MVNIVQTGTKYLVTDEKNYIYIDADNQLATSTNVDKAKLFNTYGKAENLIKSMKKTLQIFNWQVKALETKEVLVTQDTIAVDVKTDTNIKSQNVIIDTELDNIVNKIKEVEEFTKQLKIKQKEYLDRYNLVSQEIIDIEHAAEFYKLNAVQGYKIYKMLHDARIERRKCKDGLSKISYILEGNFQDCSNEKISHQIEGMDHRQYRPRVLNELFNA